MNLTSLLAECYRRLSFTPTPQAVVVTRLTAFLNEAHRRILTSPGMELLRDDVLTFASVAAQSRYGLPPNVARIKTVVDATNQLTLRPWSREDYRDAVAGTSVSGTPSFYVPIGQQFVQLQPAAATGLWAVSTSGADITTLKAAVEGVTTGGYLTNNGAGTVLTGATRVALGARTDWINVAKFYLSAACAGYVSLYTASSGGTELARIEPGRTASKYFALDLFPTPAAIASYTVDYTRLVTDMVNGTDEPFLPEDFHYLLVLMACRREYSSSNDQPRYLAMAQEEGQAFRALRSWVLYPPGYRVFPETSDRRSNLGSDYPAGRW